MTRILYVPTNRSCVPAISSGTAECATLAAETHEEHLFLLVEHDDGDRISEHSAALDEDRSRHGVPVLHLTVSAWRRVLSGILAESGLDAADRDRAGNLLTRQGVAYGVGPNKAFLVSAALGVDTVHRRDSDHLPDTRDGGPTYPGLLETRAIGRPVREVSPITNADAVPPEQWDQIVLFTGSGMFGDPPHDRQELIAAGEEFGVRVLGLSSPWMSPENLLRDVRGYFVGESTIRYDDDFYAIDDSGRTELGVSCQRRIFLELPEMPIPNTLGCDYFQKNLLYQLDRPVMFHSRKMRHSYDARRAESSVESYVDYSMRDLRYVVLWPIWSRHNENIRANPATFLRPDGSIDADRYVASFRSALAEKLPEAKGVGLKFAQVYRDAAAQVDGTRAARLSAVAAEAERLDVEIVGQISDGIEEFCWLTERWGALVRAAARTGDVVRAEIHSGTAGAGAG
ncbi:MAG: DUF6271 family protein [Pseudonocardiaceae bacterium]